MSQWPSWKTTLRKINLRPGSMLPKVQAAMTFANSKLGSKAIIASLEQASEAIIGTSGTVIHQ